MSSDCTHTVWCSSKKQNYTSTLRGRFVGFRGNLRLHCFNFVAIFGIELRINSTHPCTLQRDHCKSTLALSVLLSIVEICKLRNSSLIPCKSLWLLPAIKHHFLFSKGETRVTPAFQNNKCEHFSEQDMS